MSKEFFFLVKSDIFYVFIANWYALSKSFYYFFSLLNSLLVGDYQKQTKERRIVEKKVFAVS